MQPLTKDLGTTVSAFTLALSGQNLAWGFLQPVAGALIVRLGFRAIPLGGAGLAGTASATAQAATDVVPAAIRIPVR
jgi:hypothetical protein